MNYNYYIIIVINAIVVYLFSLQYFNAPMSYKLNNIYEKTKVVKNTTRCPHIIHQIVPNMNDVPSGLYHTIKNNIKLNPEFEYRIYDYKSIEEILKHEFDENVLSAYNSSDSYKLKSDYIKLAFIFRYGGIFIDIKNICVYRFINVFYVHNLTNNSVDLSFLASHPNNPGIKNAFHEASTRLIEKYYGDNYDEITGGKLLHNHLFYLGYLVEYSLLIIDKDNIVKLRENNKDILKIYSSFDKENISNGLLPDPSIEWKEGILYNI
jgi:hypothetical protein